MKTFTVYLDTKTGRSQVTFEAERFEITDKCIEFYTEDTKVGVFMQSSCFGLVEEQHGAAWEESPPEVV